MGFRIDLTGKIFGKLTVLGFDYDKNKWKCECSCAAKNIKYVSTKSLTRGDTKSCGCLHREVVSKDITGNRYGKLVAIELDHRDEAGRAYWKCRCDCGNYAVVPVKVLTVGNKTTCGDCIYEDLTGKKFGRLIVLEYAYSKAKKRYWKCQCSCDNKTIIYASTNQLNSGNTTSCYCKRYEFEDLTGKRFNFIEPVGYLGGSNWRCICHNCGRHDVIMKSSDIKHNTSCGCQNIAITGSSQENEIRDYIYTLVAKDKVELHDRAALGGKEIDIFIPSLSVGIEYNGSCYHASEGSPFRNRDIYYHRDKFLLAKSKGIHLVTVFDKDWEENQFNIKSILKHIICDNDKSFFEPNNEVVYTNNDYDTGEWLKDFGYKEVDQEELESFIYQNKYKVYRCGRTIWKRA